MNRISLFFSEFFTVLRFSRLLFFSLLQQTPIIILQIVENLKKKKDKVYNELSKRIDREKELMVIQQKMEIKKHVQSAKIKPKRVQKGSKSNAPVYEFQYVRKK